MRYVTRPAGRVRSNDDWWDRGSLVPDIHVYGPKEVDTGLIDRHGNSICRVQDPIGFGDRE